jgi:DNA topoisomerase VI subunit B
MDKIRSKWDFLIQCRPNVKGMIADSEEDIEEIVKAVRKVAREMK